MEILEKYLSLAKDLPEAKVISEMIQDFQAVQRLRLICDSQALENIEKHISNAAYEMYGMMLT